MSRAVAEVFADAALAYNARISGGDVARSTDALTSREALTKFYLARSSDLVRLLKSKPLEVICSRNHIGREGQALLAKEVKRILDRGFER